MNAQTLANSPAITQLRKNANDVLKGLVETGNIENTREAKLATFEVIFAEGLKASRVAFMAEVERGVNPEDVDGPGAAWFEYAAALHEELTK